MDVFIVHEELSKCRCAKTTVRSSYFPSWRTRFMTIVSSGAVSCVPVNTLFLGVMRVALEKYMFVCMWAVRRQRSLEEPTRPLKLTDVQCNASNNLHTSPPQPDILPKWKRGHPAVTQVSRDVDEVDTDVMRSLNGVLAPSQTSQGWGWYDSRLSFKS